MDPLALSYLQSRQLLGPPFLPTLLTYLHPLATLLSTPLELSHSSSLAWSSVEFWDKRAVERWGHFSVRQELREEKLEITKEEVDGVKRLRGELLGRAQDVEEERLDAHPWIFPYAEEDSAPVFSRSSLSLSRPLESLSLQEKKDSLLAPLRSLLPDLEDPGEDEEMRRMGEMPEIAVALDLHLEATPQQVEYVRQFARSVKEARSSSRPASPLPMIPLPLDRADRRPSPPLFPRPPLASPLRLSHLAANLEHEQKQENLIPPSPSGARVVDMKEWNRLEHIINLPSSSTASLPLSDVKIWSSPVPTRLREGLDGDDELEVEEMELEAPLFSRSYDRLVIAGTPSRCDSSANDAEEIDELADDDSLLHPLAPLLPSSSASLAAVLGSDSTLGSVPAGEGLPASAWIRPPHLPSPSPPSPVHFGALETQPYPEPRALALELGEGFLPPMSSRRSQGGMRNLMEVLSDDEDSEQVRNWKDGARTMRTALLDDGEGEDESLWEGLGNLERTSDDGEMEEELRPRKKGAGKERAEQEEHFVEEDAQERRRKLPFTSSSDVTVKDHQQLIVGSPSSCSRVELEHTSQPVAVFPGLTTPPFASPSALVENSAARSAPGQLESALILPDRKQEGDTSPLVSLGGTGQGGTEREEDEEEEDFIYPESFLGDEDGDLEEVTESLRSEAPADRADETEGEVAEMDVIDGAALIENKQERVALSQPPQEPLQAPTPWKSDEALSRFLHSRGRPALSSTSALAPPLPSRLTQPIDRPLQPRPQQQQHRPPPDSAIPFSLPSWLSGPPSPSADGCRYRLVAFPSLLQKRVHYTALMSPEGGMQLIDRPSLAEAKSEAEPHLLLDASTVVLFRGLRRIVGAVRPRLDDSNSKATERKKEMLWSTLTSLSARFDRIVLILEEDEVLPSSIARTAAKPYAYTPPVMASLRELALSLEEHGAELGESVVEVVLSRHPGQSADVVRKLVRSLGEEGGVMWDDERRWVSDDPTEDESYLLQMRELNPLTAMRVLRSCGKGGLEAFLDLSAEERESAFSSVLGSKRMARINATIEANRSLAEYGSPRFTFAQLEAAAQEGEVGTGEEEMMEQVIDWVAYEGADEA